MNVSRFNFMIQRKNFQANKSNYFHLRQNFKVDKK